MKKLLFSFITIITFIFVQSGISQEPIHERQGDTGIPALKENPGAKKDGSNILIEPLGDNLTPENLITSILGKGVQVYNIQYKGINLAAGSFNNGKSTGLEFESGIILSSGWAESLLGPNNSTSTSNNNGFGGDVDLTNIINATTYDACVLEFDFVPTTDYLTFNYILLSEEYPEWLSYTDVFAFLLDGQNIALIPGTSQPVSIGTINHLTNSDLYISNASLNYNLQADGFTTVLTAAASITKNESHHIKLAIADKGDRVYDSWVLLQGSSFASLGTIKGTVYDSETNEPVGEAQVEASGYSAFINASGEYLILNLPFGYGYELTAVAPGYQKKVISDINLTQDEPLLTLDIYMDPVEGDFVIEPLVPDPNPGVSTAMVNAKTIHRYYYINNELDNSPGVGIPVYLSYTGGGKTYYSNNKGIVDLEIDGELISDVVGTQTAFQIYRVLNKDLDYPINFNILTVDAEYEKYWGEKNTIQASLGGTVIPLTFHGGLSTNSMTILTEKDNSTIEPENTILILGDNANFGVGNGVGIEAFIKINDFSAGGSAMASIDADAETIEEIDYLFDYLTKTDKEAIAKYYLYSCANFGLLDNTLIKLNSVLGDYLLDKYLLGDFYLKEKGGISLTGSGSASAQLGIALPFPVSIGISAGVEVEGNLNKQLGFITDNKSLFDNFISFSADFDGSAYSNPMFIMPQGNLKKALEENLDFFNQEIGLKAKAGITITCSEDKVEISFLKRVLYNTGWETVGKYIISGDDVLYYFNSLDIFGAIADVYTGKDEVTIFIESTSLLGPIYQLFQIISNLTKEFINGNLMIQYEKYRTDFTEDEPLDLYIGVKLDAFFQVAASLGGGTTIEEGKSKLIEKGVFYNFKHLPLETYSTFINDIPLNHDDVVQTIIDDVPLYLRALIGTYQVLNLLNPFKKGTEEEIQFLLGEGGSSLTIDPAIVPEGLDSIYCVSWGWYGSGDDKKGESLSLESYRVYDNVKTKAQELYKLDYGIGGFYQIEPISTQFNGTAKLLIKYEDEEIEGLDESQLGIYVEDKLNHKWDYVGGFIDPDANTVTADIGSLGLFTVAPAVPDGEIILESDKDTIAADGSSLAVITSQPIYYNNGTLVSSEVLFTVSANNGTILNDDLDFETEGIQIDAVEGILTITLQSSVFGVSSKVMVESISGYASGFESVFFEDNIAPEKPELVLAEGFNTSIKVNWNPSPEADAAGYKIYFDSDSELPPYNGVAKINGSPSPITIGKESTYIITELFSDSTYFVAITSFDIAGNESDYSNVLVTDLLENHAPVMESMNFILSDQCNNNTLVGKVTGTDEDEDDLTYAILSGKNSDLFNIDPSTGQLSLMTGARLYDTVQNLLIEVMDNGPGQLSSTAIISIKTYCSPNNAPFYPDFEFELVDTNKYNGYIIGVALASETDPGQNVAYTILEQSLEGALAIAPVSGELSIANESSLAFNEDGEYILTVLASDDGEGWLSDTSQVKITLLNTVNQSLREKYRFNIYPNPTSGKLIISNRDLPNELIKLETLSVEGKIIFQNQYLTKPGEDIILNISDYPQGIYMIRIEGITINEIGYIIKN